MTTTLSPSPWLKFFGNDGTPLASGKLFTYSAGTTTKLATYTDSTGGTPNANPVILDSRGEANVWVPPNVSYKYVLAFPTDTDPPANPIKTVDNVVSSQLITLYGGVDTGIVNAYVLNFVANYSGYADGEYIVWIPSHTNTGASTINVNGFGVINITNADGSLLTLNPGFIVANQPAQVLIKGGAAILTTPTVTTIGAFAPTWSGFSANPSGNVQWRKNGNVVTMLLPIATGTSNANDMSFSNLPAVITPPIFNQAMPIAPVVDNSATLATPGLVIVRTSGTVSFYKDCTTTATWTASGSKGFGGSGGTGVTFTYATN